MNDYAARLQKAVADRTAIGPLDVPDLATGYAVQRELRASAGPIVGWKLGVTSRAKQAQVGIDSPAYGFLEGVNALDLGAPLDASALIQPRCEPEIVFVLGRDLAGPHVTAADVLAASSPTTRRRGASSSAPRCRPRASTCGSSGWCWRRTASSWRRRRARRRSGTRPPRSPGWSARWRPTARGCARATWCSPVG